MLYNFTFLLSSLFFVFLKIWSVVCCCIIHGRALYTGKYGMALGQLTPLGGISMRTMFLTQQALN